MKYVKLFNHQDIDELQEIVNEFMSQMLRIENIISVDYRVNRIGKYGSNTNYSVCVFYEKV